MQKTQTRKQNWTFPEQTATPVKSSHKRTSKNTDLLRSSTELVGTSVGAWSAIGSSNISGTIQMEVRKPIFLLYGYALCKGKLNPKKAYEFWYLKF